MCMLYFRAYQSTICWKDKGLLKSFDANYFNSGHDSDYFKYIIALKVDVHDAVLTWLSPILVGAGFLKLL